jgi:hypothetical protein
VRTNGNHARIVDLESQENDMAGKRKPSAKASAVARPPRKTAGTKPVRDPAYDPARTRLGAELRRLRATIVESDDDLLDWDGVVREVADRRGGVR